MMMEIKNTGTLRVRVDKELYLKPGEVLKVSDIIGRLAVRKNTDVINITPKKPKIKFKPQPKIKLDFKKLEVNEDDIR